MSTVYQYCGVLVPVLLKPGEYSLLVPLYRSVPVPIRPLIQVGLPIVILEELEFTSNSGHLVEGFQPSLRCAFPSVSSLTIDRAIAPAQTGFGLGALAFILCVLLPSGVWHGKDNGIFEAIVGVVVARHRLEQGQPGDLHGLAH